MSNLMSDLGCGNQPPTTTPATRSRFGRAGLIVVSLLVMGLVGAACGQGGHPGDTASTTRATTEPNGATAAFAGLEHRFGATLGVYALDTGTGSTLAYRADQRFAFCSTFKALAAGTLLRNDSDAQLAGVITYDAAEIVTYSPITSQHTTTGMSLDALIAAAVQYSDNTAANLLVDRLGGPAGLQRDLRGIGDPTTNVDREEPALSDVTPGDPRDTSSAHALATDLRAFVLADLLSSSRRQQLTQLLVADTTGGPYIRAGVPASWKVADKTGNGSYGTRNDIAVVWPPHRAPIVIALLSHRGEPNSSSADALLADATRVIVADLA